MLNLTKISLPAIDEFSFHLRLNQLLKATSILQTAKQKKIEPGFLEKGASRKMTGKNSEDMLRQTKKPRMLVKL